MKFKKFDDKYILRIDRGEELVESLMSFVKEEGIKLGSIVGLGATDKAEIGLFKPSNKEYNTEQLTGDYEMTSIIGNISTKDGNPYLHIHATLGDEQYNVRGGHLSSAVISGTCELVITVVNGEVDRFFDEEGVGLNLFDL